MDENKNRIKSLAHQRLVESGEREQLVQLLRTRLLECGWRDSIVENCKGIVREHGIDNVTIDMLISEVTPNARASVPDSVKKELLNRIKSSLESLIYDMRGHHSNDGK